MAVVAAPWPKRLLRFDVVINIVGYMPLGFGLRSRVAIRAGAGAGLVVGPAALATALLVDESLQFFLPGRVPRWPTCG